MDDADLLLDVAEPAPQPLAPSRAHRDLPRRVVEYSRFFKPGFLDWLETNWHIYIQFEHHALQLIERGRTHYSARTIIEVLVHNSILRESPEGEFKIGNDRAPDLARLFAVMHPRHVLFWEYRRGDWREFLSAMGVEHDGVS